MTRAPMTDLTRATWRKSSHSGSGNQCVEVAQIGEAFAVRDSKNPSCDLLTFDAADWEMFLDRVKHGRYDQ